MVWTMTRAFSVAILGLCLGLWACGDDGGSAADVPVEPDADVGEADVTSDVPGEPDTGDDAADVERDLPFPDIPRDPAPEHDGVYGYAGGCYAIEAFDRRQAPTLAAAEGDGFAFSAVDVSDAARFHMRPADLGTYLFYDADARYLVAESADDGWRFARPDKLTSSLELLDDAFVSPAEWALEPSTVDPERWQLQHLASGLYLALDGLVEADRAAIVTLHPTDGCAEFPEMSLDASGEVVPRQWEDGDVYGIAEIHSHMMANFAFGGGSIYHGAPFHRLGVEHALPDCSTWHGDEGRRDLAGFFYDNNGGGLDVDSLLPIAATGELPDFNHFTDGWPTFTDWPSSWDKSTHQTMYYRWIQRAYLAGLRLVVQHATGNNILCELITGLGAQDVRYSCNDMVSVDRSIAETRALERYIDAQAGGPGKGWFRIVESPAEARAVINEGKLAVVLGIEISNLFDCFSTPREGYETCTMESVRASLDKYEELGVRAIFPVHKYDNAFSAGDGGGGIIELGNFVNTGHYSSFVQDCPEIRSAFDNGEVTFGGLNMPRDDYDAPPAEDTTGFEENVVATLFPFLEEISEPALPGDYCQSHGLTPLGEDLIRELMRRGMMIDIAHLPARALTRTYELLEEADYPPLKTHGNSNNGRVYALGGLTGGRFGRCANPDNPGEMLRRYTQLLDEIEEVGGYPSEALSFDLNGFAGGPRPRFGDDAHCGPQPDNPIRYPFISYDGNIMFTPPRLGDRDVDFNTEGMLHIGLLPELIQDVRADGATDDDLEPLFRSAEAYIRLWERAETRAATLE